MVRKKLILSAILVTLVVVIAFVAYALLLVFFPDPEIHCDVCHKTYASGKSHNVIIHGTVDVTMCDRCYTEYLNSLKD